MVKLLHDHVCFFNRTILMNISFPVNCQNAHQRQRAHWNLYPRAYPWFQPRLWRQQNPHAPQSQQSHLRKRALRLHSRGFTQRQVCWSRLEINFAWQSVPWSRVEELWHISTIWITLIFIGSENISLWKMQNLNPDVYVSIKAVPDRVITFTAS